MSEWIEIPFSEFVDINPMVKLPQDQLVSYVEMKDLTDGKRFCFPNSERFNGSGAKFQEGDTLFARITPCLENGKIAQASGLKNGMGLGSTEFLVFRGKKNTSDNNFVYYLSRWNEVRAHAEINLDGTSGRQRVPKECFNELIISVPTSLIEQSAIANVLSSLDDKIDLLHRQNETLEKMAEALFRQWFVEEAKEDWEILPLGSQVSVKRGGSPRPIQDYLAENGLRWLKISDATKEMSPYIFEIKEFIRPEGLSKTTYLKKGTLVLSNSATPGIPKILQVDTCIHDGWLHFPESNFSNEFLYLLFKKIRPELIQYGNGSIFTNLKTEILKDYPITVPDNESLVLFNNSISPVFEKMLKNQVQIRILISLRESLLPQLLNGEVKVSQL
jgi:type I restriction enzyme S subunit